MQDERPYRPTKKASGCFACVSFLTVVDTYMQPDLPEVYHGGHAEMENKMWGAKKNVTSLHEILCFLLYIFLFFFLQYMCVCVCGAAGLTGQRRVVHPEGAACSQLPEGSAARWQDSATAPPCESEPTLQPFHVRVCVCVCVSWRVYNSVSNSTFPPRLHSWLGVRTHIKTRCQTTGLIYPRGLIQFVCKSFVLFARLPDYVERKIAKKTRKKNPNNRTPAHWLLSRDVALDSLQLGVQEAGQQLENKVLLLLTWHVPTHAQGCHISRSAPVLERWERVRDRKREREFSQKVFSTGTTSKPPVHLNPPPPVLCYLLVFKHSKLEIHYQIAD